MINKTDELKKFTSKGHKFAVGEAFTGALDETFPNYRWNPPPPSKYNDPNKPVGGDHKFWNLSGVLESINKKLWKK